jgi:hypothetical protein
LHFALFELTILFIIVVLVVFQPLHSLLSAYFLVLGQVVLTHFFEARATPLHQPGRNFNFSFFGHLINNSGIEIYAKINDPSKIDSNPDEHNG